MLLKYNFEIKDESVILNFKRITNQIYKLLPLREENSDWKKLLFTLIEELKGMESLLIDQHDLLFPLLCKLEGLYYIEDNFDMFRRTIFDCLNIMGKVKRNVCGVREDA